MRIMAQASRSATLSLSFVILLPALAAAQAPATSSPYIGNNVCRDCHAEIWQSFYRNPHYKSIASGKELPERTGCEGCHGGARAHVEAGGGIDTIPRAFSLMTPHQALETCLTCHAKDASKANIRRSEHTLNDVACTSCHSIHNAATPKYLLAKKQSDLCYTCHAAIQAQFEMPSKHRVNEGFMQCTDCHNPHGALSHAMVKAESVPQLCTSCHAEKRGPYIWEHPPVEENCLTCHNPHGSNHNRLLAEKAPNVCQDCHDAAQHPGTVYSAQQGWLFSTPATVPSTRLIARGCVNCHYNIHGSNAPAMRGKFFLR